MKIVDIEVKEIYVPLNTPFKTALRTVNRIEDVLVKVFTDTGEVGLGEAAPTAVITGETKMSIIGAIETVIKPNLLGCDILDTDTLFNKLNKCIIGNYSAKAAVDMAIYDLLSQYLKLPLFKLLGGSRNILNSDITISLNNVETMVDHSLKAIGKGFNILKVKLGNDYNMDIDRIKEIRSAVGNDVTLRVDANQGWSVKEAILMAKKFEDLQLNIELIEQPVRYDNLAGLKDVTQNTSIKILADESVFSPKDAIYIIQNNIADIINIKLMKTGGIYNALKIIGIAEIYGIECMMGCMLESKISVTAAAHLAAAKGIITMIDLDGPLLCKTNPINGGANFTNSTITLSDNIGLGFFL